LYNEDAKVIEIGLLKEGKKEGKWISYYNNGSIESIGKYYNGLKERKWTWYHDNGQICSKESYYRDDFIKGKFWDCMGGKANVSDYKIEDEYPGGLEAFRKMVNDSIKYPQIAIENGIFGDVRISFKVNSMGELVNPKIIKHMDSSLDKEALRVVKLSGLWKPGRFHNRPSSSVFVIPIIFQLQ
jgi:TonB family protein